MFIHIDISVLLIAKLFVEILYSRETALDPVGLLWDSPNPNIPRINSIIIIITSTTNIHNTITDGGSTAPLYCWYHTEERTIQEHKRDWKDVRGIVGRQTSAFAPSARRLLHCFWLKLGNNCHRLQQTATNCHILLKRADEELITRTTYQFYHPEWITKRFTKNQISIPLTFFFLSERFNSVRLENTIFRAPWQ